MVNIDSFAKGFNMLIFLKDLYCLLWSWVWLLWRKQRTERFDSHRHLQTRHVVQQFYLYAAEASEVSLTVDYMPQTWFELSCCKHPRTRIVTGVMKEENPSTQHFYRSSPFVLFSDDNEDESLGQHAPCLTYLLYKYLFASWKKPGEAKQGLETISRCQSLSCVVFFYPTVSKSSSWLSVGARSRVISLGTENFAFAVWERVRAASDCVNVSG